MSSAKPSMASAMSSTAPAYQYEGAVRIRRYLAGGAGCDGHFFRGRACLGHWHQSRYSRYRKCGCHNSLYSHIQNSTDEVYVCRKRQIAGKGGGEYFRLDNFRLFLIPEPCINTCQ